MPPSQTDVLVLSGEREGRKGEAWNQSKCCFTKGNYTYSIAAESTVSSSCSDVLIHYPVCPKADTAVWKYFMKVHFQ